MWHCKASIIISCLQMKKLRTSEVTYLQSWVVGWDLNSDLTELAPIFPSFPWFYCYLYLHRLFCAFLCPGFPSDENLGFFPSKHIFQQLIDSLTEFYFPSSKMVWGVQSFKRGYLRSTLSDCLHIITVKNFSNTRRLKLIV